MTFRLRGIKEKSNWVEAYYTVTPQQLEQMMGIQGLQSKPSPEPSDLVGEIKPGLFTFSECFFDEVFPSFEEFELAALEAMQEEVGISSPSVEISAEIKWIDPFGFVAQIRQDFSAVSEVPEFLSH